MIRTILILTIFLLFSGNEFAGNSDKAIIPTPAQEAFMKLKHGMLIHFGINTFNDKEWSYGDLLYNLEEDPNETTNLIDKYPRVANELKLKMEQFIDNLGSLPTPKIQTYIK